MRRTLLELTQDILSSVDGDEVNSISDTIESMQVVNIIKQEFYRILDERNLTYVGDLTSLQGLADTDRPNYMQLPEEFQKIEWIRYDHRVDNAGPIDYKEVHWMEPHEFVTKVNNRDSSDTDSFVVVNHAAGIPLIIDKRVGPRYWTSFDDQLVIFDSYDENVDSTLQASKCLCYAYSHKTFVEDDDYVPDLPGSLFQYLYNSALATANWQLRQLTDPKSEQRERHSRVRSQRNDWITNRRTVGEVDYGKRGTGRRTFRRRGP